MQPSMRSLLVLCTLLPGLAASAMPAAPARKAAGEVVASARNKIVQIPPTEALADVRLVATLMQRQLPVAVVRRGASTRLLRRGDRIDGVEIAAVLDGRLLLRREGKLEMLTLMRPALRRPRASLRPRRGRSGAKGGALAGLRAGIRQLGPRRYQISRQAFKEALAKPHLLARTMRVIPVSRGGRPDGFRLLYLASQSPLRTLGLRRGDVLQAINGRAVKTAEELLGVYTKLRSASHLTLGLRRAGRSESLDYLIR